MCAKEQGLPNKAEVIEIIRDLRKILFPGFFGDEEQLKLGLDQYIQIQSTKLYERIKKQIEISFRSSYFWMWKQLLKEIRLQKAGKK